MCVERVAMWYSQKREARGTRTFTMGVLMLTLSKMGAATLLQAVRDEESFEGFPYRDTTGHWTIGYGFNLDAGMSKELGEIILEYQLSECEQSLIKLWPKYIELDDVRKGVVLDCAFNMGVHGLMSFQMMLKSIEGHDYIGAANDLANSLAARQEPNRVAKWCYRLRTGKYE